MGGLADSNNCCNRATQELPLLHHAYAAAGVGRMRGGIQMSWLWRALVAVLLVGGPALWLPAASTDAAPQPDAATITVQGPAADKKDDPDDLCRNKNNPRKLKKCHFNGWDLNQNGHGNDNVAADLMATDPTATGAT